MRKTISEKLKVFSFVATIFVVYRHSLNYLAFFGSSSVEGYNGFVQDGFMSLTQIAVPYFFLVSGYFFFKKNYYEGWNIRNIGDSVWAEMIKVKCRTLLVPFIFWNVIGLLVLIITHQTYSFSLRSLLDSEWYGPLWYVRDLMFVMSIVPLYQWCFRLDGNKKLIIFSYVIDSLILLLLIYHWNPIETTFLSSEGVLFFYIGGLMRKFDINLNHKTVSIYYVIILLFWLCWSFSVFNIENCHFLFIMMGIFVIWNLLDAIPNRLMSKLLSYSRFSFLIYVMHFYIIKIMKVAMGKLFYGNELVSMLSYLILPVVCTFIIIILGKIMQRYIPQILAFTMGGRQ